MHEEFSQCLSRADNTRGIVFRMGGSDNFEKKSRRQNRRAKGYESLGDLQAILATTPGAITEPPASARSEARTDAPEGVVAHSLSSAATNEPEPKGEIRGNPEVHAKTEPMDERDNRIDTAVQGFMGDIDRGEDPNVAYSRHLRSVYSHDIPTFEERLNGKLLERDQELVFNKTHPTDAVATPVKESASRVVDNSPYIADRLADAQENLKTRLKVLRIDADRFVDIGGRIVAATDAATIRNLSREIGELEQKRIRTVPETRTPKLDAVVKAEEQISAAPEVTVPLVDGADRPREDINAFAETKKALKSHIRAIPRNTIDQQRKDVLFRQLESATTPEALDVLGKYLTEVEDGVPATPNAKGLRAGEIENGVLKKVADTFYIKSGNKTRTATAEEIAAYDNLKETIKRTDAGPNVELADVVDGARSGAVRGQYLEDMFEATGVSHEELLRRLKDRNGQRYSPTAPELRQTVSEEVVEDPREALLRRLDPAGFTPYEIHADNWRGGPGHGTPNTYTHRDALGYVFTQAEIDWAAASRIEAQRQNSARRVASERVASRPGQVVRGQESAEAPDWSIQRKEFAGLTPKSVREILANRADAKNFGELIESLDPNGLEIMRKSIANEPLTAEERKILNYGRHEYARRMKQIEFIHSQIKTSDLETVARRDEDFAAALGLDGPARTAELFKQQIVQMGMMNREALDRLYNTYENLAYLRDTANFRNWEKDINTLCEKSGTAVKDFDTTFDLRDAASRRASQNALADNFRKLMRKAVRVGDKLKPSRFSPQSFYVRGVDKELGTLTEVLKYTITNNPEVVHMLEQESFRNENLATDAEQGPHTYAEAQTEKNKAPKSAEELVQAHVKKFLTADGRDWDHASVDERTESLGELHSSGRSAEKKRGTGWFARAMTSFFRSLFGREVESAVRKPVLAH
jgi:hypothetical protein